eukprot:7294647-Karenia_brevis.AAC.1
MKRTTNLAEEHFHKVSVDDWVQAQRRCKWRFAGHCARREDERWSTAAIHWEPRGGYRRGGHPERRWSDAFDAFFRNKFGSGRGLWLAAAQYRETWRNYEDEFSACAWNLVTPVTVRHSGVMLPHTFRCQ